MALELCKIGGRDKELCENFFVSKLVNNHWGKFGSDLKFIRDHSTKACTPPNIIISENSDYESLGLGEAETTKISVKRVLR